MAYFRCMGGEGGEVILGGLDATNIDIQTVEYAMYPLSTDDNDEE